MLDVAQPVDLTVLINLCILGGSQNDFCDTSEPLFSLYSKTIEGYDSNKAERHEKDAEGIVLFVSPLSCLRTLKHVN